MYGEDREVEKNEYEGLYYVMETDTQVAFLEKTSHILGSKLWLKIMGMTLAWYFVWKF